MTRGTELGVRVAIAATLATSGYLHAQLYVTGYRFIHVIGPLFLVQSAVSFAFAALLLAGPPPLVRLAAAGVAAGALVGFALSRTVGVLGFTERGWQPAPQSLLSVLVEIATLALLAPTAGRLVRPLLARGPGPDGRAGVVAGRAGLS